MRERIASFGKDLHRIYSKSFEFDTRIGCFEIGSKDLDCRSQRGYEVVIEGDR